MMERKTVSIMQACRIVGVSRRTIYNWLQAEKVEHCRTVGGAVRIFEDTLWEKADKAVSRQQARTQQAKINASMRSAS